MAEIELTENTLTIRLRGLARFITWANHDWLTFPLSHVAGAEMVSTDVARQLIAALGPTPGMFQPGPSLVEYYQMTTIWEKRGIIGSVTMEGGQKAFWDGGNLKKSIQIRLTHESYSMFVLKVEDPEEKVARIERAVGNLDAPDAALLQGTSISPSQ